MKCATNSLINVEKSAFYKRMADRLESPETWAKAIATRTLDYFHDPKPLSEAAQQFLADHDPNDPKSRRPTKAIRSLNETYRGMVRAKGALAPKTKSSEGGDNGTGEKT